MSAIMCAIFDERPFEFDPEEYAALEKRVALGNKKAEAELVKFEQGRWNVLRKVDPKKKRCEFMEEFLNNLDNIFVDVIENAETEGFEMTDLIGSDETEWGSIFQEYVTEARALLVEYAESIEADKARVAKKLDWILTSDYRGRPLLPFPTKSVIRALSRAFGKTPEALKEVSKRTIFATQDSVSILAHRYERAQDSVSILAHCYERPRLEDESCALFLCVQDSRDKHHLGSYIIYHLHCC
jgi:hypothetical protein